MKKLTIGLGIVLIASAITAFLPKQDKKVTITITVQEADLILRALGKLPLEESGNLYMNIQAQAQAQLQPQQKPVTKADSTTKKKP